MKLVEVQLDVVDAIDSTKGFSFDHLEDLNAGLEARVCSQDAHLLELLQGRGEQGLLPLPHPEEDARAGLVVGLRQLAVVEQLLLEPLQLHAGDER